MTEPTEERKISVPGISCGHCVAAIKRELGELPGVASVEGDAATKAVVIRFGPPAEWEKIDALLREIGYPPAE